MSDKSPFLVINQSCDDAVQWITEQFKNAGLQTVRTFDLQDARHDYEECPCPHHGTARCDCQMVVLLVYQDRHQPISIIAHGNDGKTWFSVVDSAHQRADPILEGQIHHAIAPYGTVTSNLQDQAYT